MATNPNRPEYMDTIESTWGQSVADHVIRRYATMAEATADLDELDPADLEGQVIAVGAVVPGLVQRLGGLWHPVPAMDVQGGTDWISTDGASSAYITFLRPFAGPPQTRVACAGDGTGGGVTFQPNASYNASTFQVTAWNAAGGAYGAGAVFQVNWIAGYTATPAALLRDLFKGDQVPKVTPRPAGMKERADDD